MFYLYKQIFLLVYSVLEISIFWKESYFFIIKVDGKECSLILSITTTLKNPGPEVIKLFHAQLS